MTYRRMARRHGCSQGVTLSNPPPTDPPRPDPTAEPYGSSWPVGRAAVPPPPYEPPGYDAPDHQPPPRGSNAPFVAVIIAVMLLLCGGTVTATVLAVRAAADRAREAVAPITHPSLPAPPSSPPTTPKAPTASPTVPGLPGWPSLPDLPTFPSGWPDVPGEGSTITVTYEVTGVGPAEILYAEQLGQNPRRIRQAELPWKITTEMDGSTLVLVTAVRVGAEPGSIGCRATVDGRRVAQSSREGSYASVTCSKLIIAP